MLRERREEREEWVSRIREEERIKEEMESEKGTGGVGEIGGKMRR